MTSTTFDALPSDARLWIFGAARALDDQEQDTLLRDVDDFLHTWKAHGTPLTAARDWRHRRFLLVAVDERTAPPSGCSIDAMVRVLKGVEGRLGVTLIDNASVWFTRDGEIQRASRPEFTALVSEGVVGPATPVFDGSVTRVADVREGRWETLARETWLARAFFATAST